MKNPKKNKPKQRNETTIKPFTGTADYDSKGRPIKNPGIWRGFTRGMIVGVIVGAILLTAFYLGRSHGYRLGYSRGSIDERITHSVKVNREIMDQSSTVMGNVKQMEAENKLLKEGMKKDDGTTENVDAETDSGDVRGVPENDHELERN